MNLKKFVAGRLIDKKNNFIFQVLAYRKMSGQELQSFHRIWLSQRDKRKSFKDKTVTMDTNMGMSGGFW
jgi:hypothetical protein